VPLRVNSAVAAAIVAGLFWCVAGIDLNAPQFERVLLLITGGVLLWATLRGSPTSFLAGSYAVLVAISERASRDVIPDGSDVLRATDEALDVFLGGGDPYRHVLESTIPPGSPFVYPPGEFLFYLPFKLALDDITRVDTWTGVAIVVLIVIAGTRVGFDAVALPAMLYATWGAAAFHAVDGSNDVSASFVLVLALVLAAFAAPTRAGRWAFFASAFVFGWAMGFKQFAILALPALLRHLAVAEAPWRRYAVVAVGTTAALVLPFLIMDPGAFVEQQLALFTFHRETWGANLLAVAARFVDPTPLVPIFFALELLLTGVVIAITLRWRVPTLGAAALAASGAIVVPLLLARWTTQPYYVYVGALVACGVALLNARARPA
jgi:hypothetical protein